MNQASIAHILKAATLVAAIVLALVFFWYLPLLGYQISVGLERQALFLPGLILLEGVALLIYLALWQFWKVCRRIGKSNSFCRENARSFLLISRYALAGTLLVALAAVAAGRLGLLNGAWLIALGLTICVGLGVLVLSWCLAHLIGNAAELKEQADLTV